ncbi:MAG: Ig-like domain-containing protein [Ignavibacteriales bacterium]|nr:Ig-like domain-containing protein [Ignavibacteriales bacterium]
MKPKAMYPLAFVAVAAAMFVTSTSAAIAQTAQQVSSTSGSTPVNPSALSATTNILNPGVVSWVHFGDLLITTGDQQNYADFKTIINCVNRYLKNGVNFALLPGDNTNDNTESEFQLIKQATDQLQVPLYAILGGRDHKGGTTLYNKYLEPVNYQSFTADRYHFVFLDVMSGISDAQNSWLTNDLDLAAKAGLKSVIFMHSYAQVSELQEVIQRDNVIMVDAGYTHYNDVSNDGNTIYATTRSTGLVSEGPVGFSITNLDNGVVSWKFKQMGSWPFVMITSPADKLLMIGGSQVVKDTADVRAKVWDDKGVASVSMQIDGGQAVPLARIGETQMWSARFDATKVSDGDHRIKVKVTGTGGNTDQDVITVTVNHSGSVQQVKRSFGPDGNSVGAYIEKGLLGTHTTKSGYPDKVGKSEKH